MVNKNDQRAALKLKEDPTLKSNALKSKFYKKLNLPYPNVKGYCKFSDLAYDITLLYGGLNNQARTLSYYNTEVFTYSGSGTIFESMNYLVNYPTIPVHYLESSLFQSLLKTDTPSNVFGLTPAYPYGILMLPEALINPEGEEFNWISYKVFEAGEEHIQVDLGNWVFKMDPNTNKFIAVFCLSKTLYGLTVGIPFDETGLIDKQQFSDAKEELSSLHEKHENKYGFFPDIEEPFSKKLESIVIQTLLYLQTRPEDVTPVNPYSLAPVEPKQAKKGGKKRYTPLMIGKQFKPKTETVSLGGTHASPRTHWRRGHWRRVAIGEGRGERKWHWFQPVLVNG